MNKKLLLLILCIIGLLLWTVSFFFGFNYIQKGALMVSIPVTLFVFLLMGFMIFLMKRFSDPQGADNYRLAKNTETAAIVIYAIASLCTAVFIGHFVNVTMNEKTAVQDKVDKELRELERIFYMPEMEETEGKTLEDLALLDIEEGSYLAWVLEESDNYQKELSSTYQDSTTVDARVEAMADSLLDKSGFWNLLNEVHPFIVKCRNAVERWNWLTVSERISMLEANKKDWENKVEKCATYCQYTKNEGYKCNAKVHYSDIAAQLTTLSTSDFSLSALLLIIVLQVMMLLSYIAGRPKTGKDPLKYTDAGFARSYGAKNKKGAQSTTSKNRSEKHREEPTDPIILDD